MKPEFQDLEDALSALRPAPVDAELLARLEAAMNGSLDLPTIEGARVEAKLREAKPAALPAGLMASLERSVASTPFPLDDTIVLFTQRTKARGFNRRYRPVAAAAAVACLGALAALFMPVGKTGRTPSVAETRPAEIAPVSRVGYVPASFGRGVQDASDEGVVWKDGRPHRMVKVVYKELGSFTNAEGKKVDVEQPRVEYILVPEKVD